MPLLLISALSVLCFSNLRVVIPPSGFIDTMMERSNRTRGAFVSPNHLGLCWKQRDRGGGGEQGGGGRDKSEEDPHRERERQHRLLFDFLWLRRKKNTSYSGCPSHQPCSRQTRQRGDRRSTQRPSFSFLSLDLCQRHLWACRGPVDTERLPRHMPVCFPQNLLYLFMACAYGLHGEPYGEKLRMRDDDRSLLLQRKGEQPSRDRWQV